MGDVPGAKALPKASFCWDYLDTAFLDQRNSMSQLERQTESSSECESRGFLQTFGSWRRKEKFFSTFFSALVLCEADCGAMDKNICANIDFFSFSFFLANSQVLIAQKDHFRTPDTPML